MARCAECSAAGCTCPRVIRRRRRGGRQAKEKSDVACGHACSCPRFLHELGVSASVGGDADFPSFAVEADVATMRLPASILLLGFEGQYLITQSGLFSRWVSLRGQFSVIDRSADKVDSSAFFTFLSFFRFLLRMICAMYVRFISPIYQSEFWLPYEWNTGDYDFSPCPMPP